MSCLVFVEKFVPVQNQERSTVTKYMIFFHSIACEHQNGPNCYIFVVGMSAEVIKELAAIKLPVNVLINVHVKVNDTAGKLRRIQLGNAVISLYQVALPQFP